MSILLADIDATCAALGYYDNERYLAEPDALQGLRHLIWILRRDLENHEYRRHLGHAKVLQTDLVHMLHDYVHDPEYTDALVRLMVILTNPTLLLYREGPPKDFHSRKVFMELIEISQGYKSAFTQDKVWVPLYGIMKKGLEIDWAIRSEEQSLMIERVLVLIRNVLQVPANPEAECRADNDASLHDQVIWALHQSGLMDLVLFVVSSPDEHQFHLHGLEILCLLYREQTAESLADASLQRSIAEKQRDEQELLAARRRERQRLQSKPPTMRHSRFGGTYVIRNMKSVSDRDIICHQPLERVMSIDFDREKNQQKRSFRHVKEEVELTRRSAFSVRLCLREFCIEILRSAYNTLVRQVRRVLERNAGTDNHDDSYLLWAIRFFMEFNRLSGMQLELVSESLSVQCFHWVLTRMQHDMDMIISDKKQARVWAKRLHVALQTFRELLLSLLALQKVKDDRALALFDMLLNNVCYVLEYRETILHLLMNYNEAHSTKAYLRDVIETANIFIKMMEKFCKDTVLLQEKKRTKKGGRKSKANKKPEPKPQLTEEELSNKWAEIAGEISETLTNELQLPEEDQPLPFDATSEKSIDDQKEDCMLRLHRFLLDQLFEKAVSLLRAAREVWPENDVFGAMSAAPEDELLLLREIYMHNIESALPTEIENGDNTGNAQFIEGEEEEYDEEENEEYPEERLVERPFKFEDFAKRLLNPKIVRACTLVLTDWNHIPTKSLKAAVTILHRIAVACSCPAMLYHAKLLRIFQQVFNVERDAHHEELRRLGIYVVRKFVEVAPKNPKIYAELLFWKNIKEANELEGGYLDAYEPAKGVWTEEQEDQLRMLFEENQRNPETDKDVIDWILEHLNEKTRTRRMVLKKMKEMGLVFKAPTKRTTASAANKKLWSTEEDEELQSLYDEHRLEDDCLQRIINEFVDRRTKRQIIQRLLQLHIIADKSEIMPKKKPKRKSKKASANSEGSDNEGEYMDEPQFGELLSPSGPKASKTSKKKKKDKLKKNKNKLAATAKPAKPVKRKIVRTPLDVGTVKALIAQVADKYQEAIDWLKECLDDAAEDTEEPGEEDDGVPLVPLQEIAREAMENTDFQKIIVALGIQPPLLGTESYWRIPVYLNSADLKFRAKIVAGEEIDIDMEGVEEEGADTETAVEVASGDESDDDDDDDDESDSDSDSDAGGAARQDSESEEDFFDNFAEKHKKRMAAMDDFVEKRAQKMRSIMFNKSDEEDTERAGIGQKKKRERKSKASKGEKVDKNSDNDATEVDEIVKKLDKKRRQAAISSDDDDDDDDDDDEAAKSTVVKQSDVVSDLFDQLKSQTAKKKREATTYTEEMDELNFNSEDYRKRLLELGDSDEDDDEDAAATTSNTNKTRMRRANIIDSDSEEDDSANVNDEMNKGVNEDSKGANDNGVVDDKEVAAEDDDGVSGLDAGIVSTEGNQAPADDIITTSNSTGPVDELAAHTTTNKRKRNILDDSDEEYDTTIGKQPDSEEEDAFIMRRKPTKEEQQRLDSGEEPAKRRRLAIIDDDDDDE
ncbi:protein timeless homolog [Bactrocera tryoni]|uniref:protein timeless homolog n=1 Tax=Bactrocera tryoni TaxID=59916 RepID=UPI001A958790|nr:protein timeless homolog [Bactrocera tryoni]